MNKLLLIFTSIFLVGCSSTESLNLPPPREAHISGERSEVPFKINSKNKYAFIIRGETFKRDGNFTISSPDDLSQGKRIIDPYIENDIDQISRLALSKGYDVYVSGRQNFVNQLFDYLEKLEQVSNDETQILIAYSGEGDKDGWITQRCLVSDSRFFTMEACRIRPSDLIASLIKVRGKKAILINACESGCFADEAYFKNHEFQGVVISSCAVGFSTTPHEPSNLSATYAAFLSFYQDDPTIVKNLSRLEMTRTGYWWNNFLHQLSDLTDKRLPVSYQPIIYSNTNFLF